MTLGVAGTATAWRSRAPVMHESYLVLLCFLLSGYAFVGRGFAYLGVPPFFIGEVTLALGCIVLWRTGCLFALTTSLPAVLLATLLAWGVIRTVPYLGIYGIDAPRDGMVLFYGVYAFVLAGILIERSSRLGWLLAIYRRMAILYGYCGGLLFAATKSLYEYLPALNGASIPFIRPGEAAVHLAGAATFALVGLVRVRWYWILAWIVGAVLVSPSRGAMLACLVPPAAAIVLSGQLRRVMPALLAAAGLFALSLVTGLEVPLPGEGRKIGAEQLTERVGSIVGQSEDGGLDGTKQWRLRWWGTIRDYTLGGPYFWTGKGFGVNLAEDDNFMAGERGEAPLRSPHNVHLTILARGGVPGLTLWILTLVTWFGAVARAHLAARRRGEADWAALFIWIGCYASASLINASFDVALEGPMQGIWFWCLFGLGVGMVMIYEGRIVPGRPTSPKGRAVAVAPPERAA